MNHLRISTRKSPLALWQAEHVRARLMATHPGLTVELVKMSTEGDRILDAPLAKVGGKDYSLKSWSRRCSTDVRTLPCTRLRM